LLVCSFLPHNDTLMFDGYCLSLKCPVLLDQYNPGRFNPYFEHFEKLIPGMTKQT
jgi:hypothetical protein